MAPRTSGHDAPGHSDRRSPDRLRRDDRHPHGALRARAHRRRTARRGDAVRRGLEPARAACRELVLFRAARRACSAARTPTSARTTSSARATARSSSASPTTASSGNCASTSAGRISRPIRGSRPMRSRVENRGGAARGARTGALPRTTVEPLCRDLMRAGVPAGPGPYRSAGVRAGACRASRHASSRTAAIAASAPPVKLSQTRGDARAQAAAFRRARRPDPRRGRLHAASRLRICAGRTSFASVRCDARSDHRPGGDLHEVASTVRRHRRRPGVRHARRRAGLSEQAGQDHRRVPGGTRHRRRDALHRRAAQQGARPELLHREQARRRRQHRHRGRRAFRARRLYADDGHQCHARHQPVPVRHGALRCREGFRADHPHRIVSDGDRRQSVVSRQLDRRHRSPRRRPRRSRPTSRCRAPRRASCSSC